MKLGFVQPTVIAHDNPKARNIALPLLVAFGPEHGMRRDVPTMLRVFSKQFHWVTFDRGDVDDDAVPGESQQITESLFERFERYRQYDDIAACDFLHRREQIIAERDFRIVLQHRYIRREPTNQVPQEFAEIAVADDTD